LTADHFFFNKLCLSRGRIPPDDIKTQCINLKKGRVPIEDNVTGKNGYDLHPLFTALVYLDNDLPTVKNQGARE
jgi:hypothetical protein